MKTAIMRAFLLLLLASPVFGATNTLENFMVQILPSENNQCAEEFIRLGKCIAPHELLIKTLLTVFDGSTFYNPAIMKRVLLVLKNVTACFGEAQCEDTKFLKYIGDGAVFIGEKVYDDAFHCFINADVIRTAELCSYNIELPSEQGYAIKNKEIYDATMQPILSCVLDKINTNPSCTMSRRFDLFRAGRALLDVSYTVMMTERKLPVSYEFNSDLY